MVESFDFSLGIILGIEITFMANYLTEKWKESEQRKTLARALIAELKYIRDSIKDWKVYKIKEIVVFSANIPKLVLFKEQTIDAILRTYHDVNFHLHSVFNSDDIKQLSQQIDDTIKIVEKER